ncbi:TetR/AcrR family transcriptional regulator [soil metagenome]
MGQYAHGVPRPRLTDIRRHQILEAAAAVIAERGLADARVSDIAARIDVSPALILYYFESKDVLLGEALAHKDRQFFDSVEAAMADEPSPVVRLALLIEASCPTKGNGVGIDDEYVLWIEAWARARHDKDLAQARVEMDTRWRTTIADVVEAGKLSGEFDASVPTDDFALKLSGLIDGLAIQVLLGEEIRPEHMRRLCLESAASDLGFDLSLVET